MNLLDNYSRTATGSWSLSENLDILDTPSPVWHHRHLDLSISAISVISKVESFGQLERNWNSYNAAAPDHKAIEHAVDFVRCLDKWDQSIFFVAPGPDGQILVEVKNETKTVEFTFYSDGTAAFARFDGDTFVDEGEYAHETFPAFLVWLQR